MKPTIVILVLYLAFAAPQAALPGEPVPTGDAEFEIDSSTESFVVACINSLDAREGYCRIHRCPLVPGCTSVVYGLPSVPNTSTYRYLRLAVFPYSRRVTYAGCIEQPPGNHEAEVMFCPVCRDAEVSWGQHQWRLAHARGER